MTTLDHVGRTPPGEFGHAERPELSVPVAAPPADARVQRLTAVRRADGDRKRQKALATVERMIAAGRQVTFAAVAEAARVSTWFVYNDPTVRAVIESARTATPPKTPPLSTPSMTGLRADLVHAREEVRELRVTNERLLERVRRSLGSALEQTERFRLIDQINELERQNAALASDLHATHTELVESRERLSVARDELVAARNAVKRIMRTSNRSHTRTAADPERPPATSE